MVNRLIVPLLCAAAVAFACGPRAHSSSGEAPTTTAQTPQKHAPDDTTLASSFDLSVDGSVKLALHATNHAGKRIEVVFPDGKTHDFVVLDSVGREVWRWSEGRLFTQALQNKVLAPDETMTYAERWEPKDAHGTFTAVAILNSTSHPIESRVEFTLP